VSLGPDQPGGLRAAIAPTALRAALVPRRPVFGNPWEKTPDMFACYLVVSVVNPFVLWLGAKLMGPVFNFSSRWPLGLYMGASLVGAAGFMTIVGRERTRLAVDLLAVTAWLLLGLVVAPVIGLGLSTGAALACYGALLVGIFLYVVGFGRWEKAFVQTLSWPSTWSSLALLFAFCAHQLILYQ
jgi:hypothetical protein